MDYCRKARCLLPRGKLDGLCTQGRYAHGPLPFQWPSRTWARFGLSLVQTYVSRSRWWHGTASRSFAPLRTPFAIGTPWQSAWCKDPGQPLSPTRPAWSLPDTCLWNAQNEVDCSKLFSNAFHTCSTFLRSCTVSSRVSQRLYASSPPATSMRAHCLSSGIWSATKITSIRRLKTFQAAYFCLLLSSSSPDTSPLGSTACLLQLDGPFRTTKENWMRDISATIEDSNLMFGMHWGMLRQCPLVIAYRGRTDRDWNIEVNYVLSWNDQVIAYG